MSWYSDPQLFMYWSKYYGVFRVLRIKAEYSVTNPFREDGFYSELEDLNFSKHLDLGNNKESDYDAFKSSFPRSAEGDFKYINCQGLVVNWIEKLKLGIWSREELESDFYSLPSLPLTGSGAKLLAEKRALEEKVSDLQAENSSLRDEIQKERDGKSDHHAGNHHQVRKLIIN